AANHPIANKRFTAARLDSQRPGSTGNFAFLTLSEHLRRDFVTELRVFGRQLLGDAQGSQTRFIREVGLCDVFERKLERFTQGNLADLTQRLLLLFGPFGRRKSLLNQREALRRVWLLPRHLNRAAEGQRLECRFGAGASKLEQLTGWPRVRPLGEHANRFLG